MEGGNSNQNDDHLITNSQTYRYLKEKYQFLSQRVCRCVEMIIKKGSEVKGLNFTAKTTVLNTQGKSPQEIMLEEQRMKQPQVVILQIEELMNKLMNLTSSTIKAIQSREDSQNGAFDEALLRLEKEIRQGLKIHQKLNTKIECLQTQLETVFKGFHAAEEQVINLQKQITKIKTESALKIKLKDQEIVNMKKQMEIKKIDRRKTKIFNSANNEDGLGGGPTSSAKPSMTPSQPNLIPNDNTSQFNFPAQNTYGDRPSTTGLVNRSHSSKMMLKGDHFQILRKSLVRVNKEEGKSKETIKLSNELMDAHRMKEMDLQKHQYDINRFNIQIKSKELENEKLKSDLKELQEELRGLKQVNAKQQQNKWQQQILSDQNPYSVEFFKKKYEEKEKEVKVLRKAQKQFVIMQQKLFVKEKAFEYERKEYHDTLIFLNDRTNKLDKQFRDAQNTKTQIQKYGHTTNSNHNDLNDN